MKAPPANRNSDETNYRKPGISRESTWTGDEQSGKLAPGAPAIPTPFIQNPRPCPLIPIRLQLRNFMSYGDEPQTLDFAGIHVACLSGDNGNGKSALLDALTYALWGKTRATGTQASGE